ncbi:hypothetical protein BDD12DRAFT_893133 [Trichophaea hybrida]|nr:hypothetical protein BDD12DRAFT_893133 [Trichophaea hybrida]
MDNHRDYGQDAMHNEFTSSNLSGGQTFNYYGSETKDKRLLRRRDEILKLLELQTKKSTFLGLLSIVNQEVHMSEIPPIHPSGPKLFWIFENIDYKDWQSPDGPQVLWLSGPPNCGMTGVASHTTDHAKRSVSTQGNVWYFFCSAASSGSSIAAAFIHTLLHQIIACSSEAKAQSIANAFLGTLLLDRSHYGRQHLEEIDSSNQTVKDILEAQDGVLWEAFNAVVGMIEIQELSLIIDGFDKVGPVGAKCIENLCLHLMETTQKFKALLTSRPSSELNKISYGMLCIEYDKERKECLHSLHFDDTRYDKISNEHEGSLEWLWTHEKYKAWSASESSSLLYLEGKPGSGKSTLAKYFKENIAGKEPNCSSSIVVHYFYTFRGTMRESNHSNMLQSILYTILEQDESFFFHFQGHFRQFRKSKSSEWPYNSLKRVLSSLADHPVSKQLYLILDAMDESDEEDRREIIKLLCQLCSREESCIIKIFLASRPATGLDSLRTHHIITLQEENKGDISRFTNDFLLDLKLADDISAKIKEYITTHAQGVFVWVYLATRELQNYVDGGHNKKGIIRFLERVPKDLMGFYQMMLERLNLGSDLDIADGLKVFQLVLFASRPLRVVEFQHALAIPGDFDPLHIPTHETFQKNINEDIEKRILHCGGNFLETKGHDGDKIVQAIHQTVREFFLLSTQDETSSKFMLSGLVARIAAHKAISTTCVRYLRLCFTYPTMQNGFPDIELWAPQHYETYTKYLDQWPLINYALENLKEHLDNYDEHGDKTMLVSTLVNGLADNLTSRFLAHWIASHLGQIHLIHPKPEVVKDGSQNVLDGIRRMMQPGHNIPTDSNRVSTEDFKYEALNTAAKNGLSQVVSALLITCTPINGHTLCKTPLIISAGKGHEATVQLLLERGANKEDTDDSGQTALHHAAKNGHVLIVSLLLERGADKSVKDNKGRTALRLAILK